MAHFQAEVKVLDLVDLTGETPVHDTKTVVKEIPVVDLDEKASNDDVSVDNKLEKKELCEICERSVFKYRCPACNTKTCSLLCVRNHKSKYHCSGERDKTAFVSRSQFENFHLLSDYRFLEEAGRVADNAKRDYKSKQTNQVGRQGNILRKGATDRGVQIFRMARGMQRWKENKSRFHIKENTIYWTTKFIFHGIMEEVITRCSENEKLETVLSPYVSKNEIPLDNRKKFLPYIAANNNIHILFKHELKSGENNKKYTSISMKDDLKTALNGKSVLEYPIFVVALSQNVDDLLNEQFSKVSSLDIVDESESDKSDDDNAPNIKKQRLEV